MEVVGKSVPRIDALDKVTGKARFAGDHYRPDMLHMKFVFSGRPHGRIRSMDLTKAAELPGVCAVLTARDVPVNRYGLMIADQPVFCDQVVRFVGDQVAAVVAVTPEIAARAAGLVEIDYLDLPVLDNPWDALHPDAPRLHEEYPGNVLATARVRRGCAEEAFRKADLVLEQTYRTAMQEHAYLEPEAGLAHIDDDGRVTIHAAGQSAHDDQRQIALALGLPLDQVRVIYGPIGGAFGGREDISVQIALALAAWRLRRPVRAQWSRRESILGHGKRHDARMRHKWGATQDGKVIAAEVEILLDAGAYAYTSSSVLEDMHASCIGPYDIPNVSMDARAVYTNNVPGCAFRGFGAPQAMFASELHLTRMAERLGIDPITMRLRNCLRDGARLPTQSIVPGRVSLPELIKACARASGCRESPDGWELPKAQRGAGSRRGYGVAIGMRHSGIGYGFPDASTARVVLFGGAEIERAEVYTAAADVGQGAHTVLAQIAAEALHVPLGKIHMATGDTGSIGEAGTASASRLTIFAGNAVKQAAEKALARWLEEIRPAEGEMRWESPRTTAPDPETGACTEHHSYSYAAEAVEVEVDADTGRVEVKKVVVAQDPGRAVNPQLVQGQIRGAVVQAQGWTLLEDFATRGGYVLTDQLSTYLIPTVADIPEEVRSILLETPDPLGPYGVRGAGEIPFIPLAPAILSAVHDALGIWFNSLPLRAAEVLEGLASLEP